MPENEVSNQLLAFCNHRARKSYNNETEAIKDEIEKVCKAGREHVDDKESDDTSLDEAARKEARKARTDQARCVELQKSVLVSNRITQETHKYNLGPLTS